MSAERHLLFAVLAFENELIDLAQLTSACRAWAEDKSKPLADLLVERGWLPLKNREFIDELVERKLAKHQQDARLALTVVTRGNVCDALKELDDSDINQSLSSWPSGGPVLVETIGYQPAGSEQSQSRYTWVSEVGKGGLGRVWLARDNELVREVALKEIKPGSESNEAIRCLIKEAQITGQLQHPNIVPIYEMNRGGRPFYTMKLVKGETLAQAIKRHHQQFGTQGVPDDAIGPNHTLVPAAAWNRYDQSRTAERAASTSLSMQRLMSVFLNVCDALAYAHSRGIIHRDLKPQNIVLGDYGEAIVLDWGLARRLDQKDDEAASVRITDDAHTEATQAGAVIGSPPYMAPEQAAGQIEQMDQRTDVYGLGAILFAILTGEAPHRKGSGESVSDVLKRITQADAPRVRDRDPNLPEELDAVCAKAMAKSRDERFATAKELKAALLEYQVHKESIDLTATAVADLEQARRTGSYPDYNRALFGFEEASRQWPANTRAAAGITETRGTYAESAFQHGDYDLALSLLEPIASAPVNGTALAAGKLPIESTLTTPPGTLTTPVAIAIPLTDHAALRTKIQHAAAERASRQHRIRRLRRFGITASLTAAMIASIAALWINAERQTANIARQNAITAQKKAEAASVAEKKAKDEEVQQRLLAVAAAEAEKKAKEEEIVQRQAAEKARDDEAKQRILAVGAADAEKKQRLVAEQETKRADANADEARRSLYAAHMNLIQRNWETQSGRLVRDLLDKTRPRPGETDLRGFEWHYWDRLCHSYLLDLKGHNGPVTSVAFSPDGKRLASASYDNTVRVWDTISGRETLTFKGHKDMVEGVAFSPDGKRLASASRDRTVKVWDATSGQEMITLKGHTNMVMSVVFSADGKRLASAGGEVKVWDATSGQEMLTLKGHSVAFSPDGTRLAAASSPNMVRVWDSTTGQEMLTLKGHTGEIFSVAFSPDGKRLASASYDLTVRIWDATSGQETLALKDYVGMLAFSADGKRIASGGREVKVFDATNGKETFTLKGHASGVISVAFSPDGKRLAIGGGAYPYEAEIKVWDATIGQEMITLKGHTNMVMSVAFSADGKRSASASYDNTVKVWDTTTGQETLTVQGHIGAEPGVALSANGNRLASAIYDNSVKVWDSTTGQETLTLKGHIGAVKSVAFSADGQRLAAACGGADNSEDNMVKVWDATSGQEKLTLKGHFRRAGQANLP